MLKVLIVAACFVFAGMVVNYSTHGKLFKMHAPDPPPAVTSSAGPSSVRVVIGGQVWTCRIKQGRSSGCTLTWSPSVRVRGLREAKEPS
jgi:hypothetical protein